MNVIARLEYELAYYDSAVHRFNHYTTRTPPHFMVNDCRFLCIYCPMFLLSQQLCSMFLRFIFDFYYDIYAHIYFCVCLYTCMCVLSCIFIYIYIYIYIYSFCACLFTCIYVFLHAYVCVIHIFYIYLYSHPQQICFVLSELISVARQYFPVAGIKTRLTQTSNQGF